MLRGKLLAVLLGVLALLAATTIFLQNRLEQELTDRVEKKVQSGNESVRMANRVDDYSLIQTAERVAALSGLEQAFGCPLTEDALAANARTQTPALDAAGKPVVDAQGRAVDTTGVPMGAAGSACSATSHVLALKLLKSWNDEAKKRRSENEGRFVSERDPGFAIARDPDVLMVTNAQGVVVARAGFDMDDYFGAAKPKFNALPVVADTKDKGTQHDVVAWRDHNDQTPKMAQVAAAPIRDAGGNYIGSAVVGYFVTNDGGKEDAPDGLDVAYFVGDKGQIIFGGSSVDDSAFLSALTTATYTERSDATAPSMTFAEITTKGIDGMYSTTISDKEFFVMPSSFAISRADRASQVGFLVIGSVTEAVAPVGAFRNTFLAILLALYFLGAVVILLIVKSFMEPIEEISKGIQEVIAGKVDYMWPVEEASHLSDMSHSLNVMSFKLQGKGDPDSDDASGNAEWAGLVGGPQAPAAGGKPGVVSGLGGIRGRRPSDSNTEG